MDNHGKPARQVKKAEWLTPVWNYALCVDCGICVQSCPTGCIALANARNHGTLRPSQPLLLDPKRCIGCSFCANACPAEAITMRVNITEKA